MARAIAGEAEREPVGASPGARGAPNGSLATERTRFSAVIPRVTPRKSTTSGASATTLRVVDLRMRGDHAGDVAALELVGELAGAQPELGDLGDVGVVVGDLGAEVAQQAGDLQRRGLAQVADAGLVGDPQAAARASRGPACRRR